MIYGRFWKFLGLGFGAQAVVASEESKTRRVGRNKEGKNIPTAAAAADMECSSFSLSDSVLHTSWNYSGERYAAACNDGSIQIWSRRNESGDAPFSCTSQWKAHNGPVLKVVWAPPEFGDMVVSCSTDGCVTLWEEVAEGDGDDTWRLCSHLEQSQTTVLDVQFGNCLSGLKLVTAGADGHVKIYETTNTLELKHWQLQAEFSSVPALKEGTGKVSCTAASISWRPPVDSIQRPVFVLGYCSSSQQVGPAKVWEFAEAYQRWQLLTELAEPNEKLEPVHHVSWAPNVGRPYELIAVSSGRAVSIWRLEFSSDSQGRISVSRVAHLQDHNSEVWHLDWDMSGMTLATSGSDGNVRLWQASFGGQWQQQGIVASMRES